MRKNYFLFIFLCCVCTTSFSQDTIRLNSNRKFTVSGQQFRVNQDLSTFLNNCPHAKKEYESYIGIKALQALTGAGGGILILSGTITKTKGQMSQMADLEAELARGFGEALVSLFSDEDEPTKPGTNNRPKNLPKSKKSERQIKNGQTMTRLGWGMVAGSLIMNFWAKEKLNNAVRIFNNHQKSKLSTSFQKLKPDGFNFDINPAKQTMQLQLSWTLGK